MSMRKVRAQVTVLLTSLTCLATAAAIDLGDIAVGGNGTGSMPTGTGLVGFTGKLVDPNTYGGTNSGAPKFTRTDGSNGTALLPYVDGVFVPSGMTQIRSGGGSFSFPLTGGRQYDAMRSAAAFVQTYDLKLYPIRLPDQPGVNRRGLGMHVNTGITYDLVALRDAGYTFDAVSGVAGWNYTAQSLPNTDVEIWVIVDGVQKYRQAFRKGGLSHEGFSIPLPSGALSLTIASTDFNRSANDDHAVIADLALVPEPAAALLMVLGAGLLRRR